ncbi:hypothetical protein HC864_03010, partial [Candidatus Gracilibacteria bacterium]|nr:hypothetical protein [Candidatus Gracilibacteria bacterium]
MENFDFQIALKLVFSLFKYIGDQSIGPILTILGTYLIGKKLGIFNTKLTIISEEAKKEAKELEEAKENMQTQKIVNAVVQAISNVEDKNSIGYQLTSLSDKIDGVETKLTQKIEGVETKLTQKIEGVETKLT